MAGLVLMQNAFPPTIPGSEKLEFLEVTNITKIENLTINGTLTANAFSDGVATLSGGTLTGLVAPTNGSDATNKDIKIISLLFPLSLVDEKNSNKNKS